MAGAGTLAIFIAFGLPIWDPEWFGPRWYRRLRRAHCGVPNGGLTWMAEDPLRSGESTHDATQRHLSSGRPVPDSQSARLVTAPRGRLAGRTGEGGRIAYYPHAPVFLLDGAPVTPDAIDGPTGPPPVQGIIPGDTIQSAGPITDETLPNGSPVESLWPWLPLRIDTDDGTWVFEARRPGALTDEIHRRYVDTSTDMYGVRLPKSALAEGDRKATA